MGAGVMDDQQITNVYLRQHPVDGEFVAVLTQGAGDVVLVVTGQVLLAHHSDVVIGPIDGRPHQIGGTGVHPNIILIGVLLVENLGDQVAVGSQHEPAQLGAEGHITHPRGDQDLLVGPPYPFADDRDVIGRLIRTVGDAHAAGQVDKGDMTAGFFLQLHSGAEENGGQGGVILVGNGVGGQESVDAELLGAQLL